MERGEGWFDVSGGGADLLKGSKGGSARQVRVEVEQAFSGG